VAGPSSMGRGAYQLPPAHVLTADLDGGGIPVRTHTYWSRTTAAAADGIPGDGSVGAWSRSLHAVLRDAVASHLMSDVPLGVFLSGGLDSGTLVALMHELGVAPSRMSRSGFGGERCEETATARQVAIR